MLDTGFDRQRLFVAFGDFLCFWPNFFDELPHFLQLLLSIKDILIYVLVHEDLVNQSLTSNELVDLLHISDSN